jgi:hypothetical protein
LKQGEQQKMSLVSEFERRNLFRAALEQFGHLSPTSRSRLAPMVYHAPGRQEEFASAPATLQDRYETGNKRTANWIALAYVIIHNAGAAFAWLERALDDGILDVSPDCNRFANLHDDPRWDDLMEKAGMSREALEAIRLTVNLPD